MKSAPLYQVPYRILRRLCCLPLLSPYLVWWLAIERVFHGSSNIDDGLCDDDSSGA